MSFRQFNPQRLRSYILRLPLCTRGLLTAVTGFMVASITLTWFKEWAALVPDKVGLSTSMCRLLRAESCANGFLQCTA